MNAENLISLSQLCSQYNLEISFFHNLNDIGLLEFIEVEEAYYLDPDKISDVEKIIRIHHDLNINIEGIDVVFNLLEKIDDLQNELTAVKNRLRIYEE